MNKTALRDARDRRGWTSRELARRSGLPESVISLMLRGYWGSPAGRARVRAALGDSPRVLFPHVPASELSRPAPQDGRSA